MRDRTGEAELTGILPGPHVARGSVPLRAGLVLLLLLSCALLAAYPAFPGTAATGSVSRSAGPTGSRSGSYVAPSSVPSAMRFPIGGGHGSIGAALPATAPGHPAAVSSGLFPGPFRSIYGVDALLNSTGGAPSTAPNFPVGETIGVLAWGWGYDPTDLATFFSDYYPSSFPPPHVIPVPIDGAPPPGINAAADTSGGSRELTLDIEWAASMAPGSTIYAIYAPPGTSGTGSPTDQSLEDALHYAVQIGNLTALSMSFGEPEGTDVPLETVMEEDIQNLTANGTTVLAASGDDGGSAASQPNRPCSAGPGVDFPAASPLVVAVGGTDATSGGPETAWDLSGGGAANTGDVAPSWQQTGGVASYLAASSPATREVPDVAATADNNAFYFAGAATNASGTSFSSPLWAGIVADMAHADHTRWGALDPRIYSLAAVHEAQGGSPAPFTSVDQGRNCYYSASPGWDRVTGWGTPDAEVLAQELNGTSYASLAVMLNPNQGVSAGSTVTVEVTLPPRSNAALAGRPMSVYVVDPTNDSWVQRLVGTCPSPGGTPWQGSFVLSSSLTDRYVNVTAVVQNGSLWGVGTSVLSPPPPPAPPGPSLWDILGGYELPLLTGFLLLFLTFRLMGDRRRHTRAGPSPRELAGQSPPTSPDGGAAPEGVAGTARPSGASSLDAGARPPADPSLARGSVTEMTPFCWKCGTTLKGAEGQCPACGTRFS